MMLPPLTALRMQVSFCLPKTILPARIRGRPALTTMCSCLAARAAARRGTISSPISCSAKALMWSWIPRARFTMRWGPICALADTRSTCSTLLAMEGGVWGMTRFRTFVGAGAIPARRTSSPWQAPSVRQTRWTATRFGLALPPTTSQATSPMSWRHYPKKSATWPRLCVFSSRREGGRRASFLRTLSTTVRKAMPSPFSIVRR